MANQSKLKAWVRYDGTGRVVTAGPIFQANKPKVGNWRQINADLCCNPSGSTTTTTTQGGGSVTPTAWFGQLAYTGPSSAWLWNACNSIGSSIIVYTVTNTAPFAPGTALYSDAALTTLIPYNFGALAINGIVYEIQNGYTNPSGGYGTPCQFITTTTTIPPIASYRVGNNEYGSFGLACANSADINDGTTLFASNGDYTGGTQLYYDSNFNFPYTGNGWRPSMTQFPSGSIRAMYVSNGVISAGLPC